MLVFKVLVPLFIIFLKCCENSKILGVFPNAGGSHNILAVKLMKGLANAGHDVTVINPYKLKSPPTNGSYTDIILTGFYEDYQRLLKTVNLYEDSKGNHFKKMVRFIDLFIDMTNKTLHHENVKNLLKSNQKFDAVILEQFFGDSLKVFAHTYDCPLILLSSIGPNAWVNPTVGNPQPISYIPNNWLVGDFSKGIPFFQRIKNIILFLFDYFLTTFYVLPLHDDLMHAAFPDAPSIFDLYTNASLVLLNSHTSLSTAVPVVPCMIEIGGYHVDPPQKLTQNLQEFLDGAKDGAIYFSMGSNLKSKDMDDERKKMLLNIFGKLKQKVLWKFEDEILPGKPDNVLIKKWMPQQDILAHPNIKLFITHGGLLSTTETIYHGVPILAIPVFGDQFMNADKAVQYGYALKISYNDDQFNEETLQKMIQELLNNKKYTKVAKEMSTLFHDRPMKPMETATYWVDYVIRNNGAKHLRVGGVNQPWYQYFLVDVLAFLVLSTLIVIFILKRISKRIFCNSKNTKKEKVN